GPCSDRIASMEKMLSTSDAGSGPTQNAPAQQQQPADTAKESPATNEMNAATGQRAASPADVRSQNLGGATATRAAQGAGAQKDVSESLRVAKEADARGDAAGCKKALDQLEQSPRG